MIIRSQNIECDVFTQTAKPVHFVQGEKGREIMFTFVNSAIPIEDEPQPIALSGLTATIHILKPDGNFIIDNMTINGNAALYVLTENACAAGGAGVYDVSLSRGTDVVYTAHGAYVGDFRAISDDVVNSVSEAYGVTFPEGFQEKLIAGDGITISDENVISAEGESYTAGDNIQISDQNVISATDTKYTAGDNIQISDQNVISATDTKYTAGNGISISDSNVISTSGEYSHTELFKSNVQAQGIVNLNDSIANYDEIEIIYGYHAGTDNAEFEVRFNAEYFTTTFPYVVSPTNAANHVLLEMWSGVGFSCSVGNNSNTALQTWGHNGPAGILAVYGIKY